MPNSISSSTQGGVINMKKKTPNAPKLSPKAEEGFRMRDERIKQGLPIQNITSQPSPKGLLSPTPKPTAQPMVKPIVQPAQTMAQPMTQPVAQPTFTAPQPVQQGFQAPPTASPFAQVTSQLSQFNPANNPIFAKAQADYQAKVNALEALRAEYADKTAQIEGRPGSNLNLAGGQQGLLNRQFASKEAAAQSAAEQQQEVINQALQATGQQQGALTSAAGLFPEALRYDLGGGTMNPQAVADQLANDVVTGKKTYDQAVSSLSYTGGAGQQFLNQAIQKIAPNFNVVQSQVLAQRQGQVAPAIENARLSLNSLKEQISKLQIPGQSSSFTPLNQLTNWASQYLGYGKEQTAAVAGTVNEVRNALQNALSLTGTNPTEATAQSYSLLPNNPSLENVNAAIQVLESLGQIKQQTYGTPGNVQAGGSNQVVTWETIM